MPEPAEVLVFRASVPDPDARETLEIHLEFTKNGTEEVFATHSYVVFLDVGGGASLALGSLIRYDPKGRQGMDLNGIMAFMGRIMPAEDFARLQADIDDTDLEIPLDTIVEVFDALVTRITGRPLVRQQPSSSGPRPTGRHSTGRRSSVAST